jgi:ribosomal protein S6E (S10)
MIDIAGASDKNGASAIVWNQHGGENQKFKVNALGQIVTFCGKVLDIEGGSDADGTPVIQWSMSNGLNQMWHFIKVV